jgi:eukaryotic-like serine/threonine-protein kinase
MIRAMIGELLEGKYRVDRLLGEGGMGAVYEAEHTLIGRKVAVKVLHGDTLDHPDAFERFQREARASTAVKHPSIIEVTDMGATPSGHPFLVMEFLEGHPLSHHISTSGRLSLGRISAILLQVLDALTAAHAKGIVHRDLKPDNIFITEGADVPDFVKVLDFGISKFLQPENIKGVTLTQAGIVLGTPSYMAPEQAMGKKDVDHRVDLWAVGVILYEALTGTLPYVGENYNEILSAILLKRPTPPRELIPDLLPEIERVILKGLAFERDDRYQRADEFAADLRALAADFDDSNVTHVYVSKSVDARLKPPDDAAPKLTPTAAPAPALDAATQQLARQDSTERPTNPLQSSPEPERAQERPVTLPSSELELLEDDTAIVSPGPAAAPSLPPTLHAAPAAGDRSRARLLWIAVMVVGIALAGVALIIVVTADEPDAATEPTAPELPAPSKSSPSTSSIAPTPVGHETPRATDGGLASPPSTATPTDVGNAPPATPGAPGEISQPREGDAAQKRPTKRASPDASPGTQRPGLRRSYE